MIYMYIRGTLLCQSFSPLEDPLVLWWTSLTPVWVHFHSPLNRSVWISLHLGQEVILFGSKGETGRLNAKNTSMNYSKLSVAPKFINHDFTKIHLSPFYLWSWLRIIYLMTQFFVCGCVLKSTWCNCWYRVDIVRIWVGRPTITSNVFIYYIDILVNLEQHILKWKTFNNWGFWTLYFPTNFGKKYHLLFSSWISWCTVWIPFLLHSPNSLLDIPAGMQGLFHNGRYFDIWKDSLYIFFHFLWNYGLS